MTRSYNKYRRRASAPLYNAAAGIGDAAKGLSQLRREIKERQRKEKEEKESKEKAQPTIIKKILNCIFGD